MNEIYQFENLGIHESILVQMAIERRMSNITDPEDPTMKKSEKEIRAILDELTIFYDDLDRNIAHIVRSKEYLEMARRAQAQESG
jgi:hypothetical protein